MSDDEFEPADAAEDDVLLEDDDAVEENVHESFAEPDLPLRQVLALGNHYRSYAEFRLSLKAWSNANYQVR